ncbi:MAG: hypothetical protein HUJ54_04110, partial [Erysipelotrichaceae bacterium]|nr:hypothetical protein [Erysipelotrichaceae bacterium]
GYEQPQQKQMQQVRSPAGYTQAPYGGPYGQQQNQPYASNPYSGQGQPAQAGYPNAGGQPYEQTPVQQPAYSQPQHRAGQQEMSYQDVMNAYGQPVSPAPVQPAPASAYAEPVYEDEYEDESVGQEHEKKKTVYSYYQISLHIAFCVYSQLILMPIMCEFLHPAFVSTDRQYSFATQVMFSLCVISAIAWTVAVFFLYLNQPSSRKIVGVCMGVEVMTAIWTGIKLMSIAKTVDIAYPWYAYALFIFLDVVRVGLILWAAWPVFTVPVPEPDESRSFMAPRFDDCEDFDDPSAGS